VYPKGFTGKSAKLVTERFPLSPFPGNAAPMGAATAIGVRQIIDTDSGENIEHKRETVLADEALD
jgi:hypothetical protein